VGRGWALAASLALGVFVISNPHLYPNPALHTTHLYHSRADTLRGQQGRALPQDALYSPIERADYLLRGSLVDNTLSGSRGSLVEAALAPLGAAALIAASWRGWRQAGHLPADAFVLVVALAYFAGIGALITLRSERYLLPTLLLGTLFSGLGLSAALRCLFPLAARIKSRAPVWARTTVWP
jgi:hypothetical protein